MDEGLPPEAYQKYHDAVMYGELDDDDDDDYAEALAEETRPIVSPFDPGTGPSLQADGQVLPLTLDNVEFVLDDVRPYLIKDGGNVALKEIDGPDVVLELEGSCSGCASSAMTMRMGIEK